MKKLLLILYVAFGINLMMMKGQSPYVSTPTLIPQNPTSTDVVKIRIHVATPNLGTMVDSPTFTVSSNPKEINIRGCYYSGMLTAIQEYIDTLVIGVLPVGTYSIIHKAYLSSAQQHCAKIDSNQVQTSFSVISGTATTGFTKITNENLISIFPNPTKDFIQFKNASQDLNVSIYSVNGSLVKEEKLKEEKITVKDLPAGVYFVRFKNGDKTENQKFVKEN